MSIQFKANQLSEDNKQEAEKIARRLFGCWDWQGIQNNGLFSELAGMSEYINRSVIRRIKPEGSTWLVGEKQFEDGTAYYFIKRL